ncbi:AMP-binding protein [Kitasatospora sp. NPDC001159]
MPSTSTAARPPLPTAPDDPVALYAVDATGAGRAVTHRELADRVDRAGAVLCRLGVRPGDRVALHLPLLPEAVVALLACTRIGAVATTPAPWTTLARHPADELSARRLRRVRLLVTTDTRAPDASRTAAPTAPPVLVVRTAGDPVHPRDGRQWWHRALAATAPRPAHLPPAPGERAAALRLGLRGPADVYWCATDLDWLVRHPEAVSGPLALGAAQVLCHDVTRLRETLHTYGVTVLHAHPDHLHDVLWRSPPTDPDTPPTPALRVVAPLPGPDASPGPDHWYWQREQHPTATWQLRHGPNLWSPPPAGTAPTNQQPTPPY